jgi:hypothetical protein
MGPVVGAQFGKNDLHVRFDRLLGNRTRGGGQCSKLLREAAGAVRRAMKIDRSFIMTTLDDPNTMLRLIEFMDACSLLRAHR